MTCPVLRCHSTKPVSEWVPGMGRGGGSGGGGYHCVCFVWGMFLFRVYGSIMD